MWRWIPVNSLSMRIVALFLGLLLLVQAACFMAIRANLDHNARDAIALDLAVGERALRSLLQQHEWQLANGAAVLAADYGFRAALLDDDLPAMEDALVRHGERVGASVTALLDSQMALRAVSRDDIGDLPAFASRLLLRHTAGDPGATIELAGERPMLFVLAPIKAPVPVGHVLMGYALDDGLAGKLRDISGLHLVVLTRPSADQAWRAPIGTLPTTSVTPMVASLHQARPREQLFAGAEEFSARPLPLLTQPRGSAEAVALLMRSVDEAIAPYLELQWTLGLLTALGVLAFGIGSLVTARHVTTPIRELAIAAERLGGGDYGTPVRGTARRDEIGELAQRFEAMRCSIADHQQEILKLAYWDRLTGLPNRLQFRDAVRAAIARAGHAPGASLGVLMLDLDRFKHINDVMGFAFGDLVLKAIAERLVQETVRDGDLVARLGDDEFAVLLPGANALAAQAIAARVAASFDTALHIQDQTVDLRAGIGIACWPAHAAEADSLLSRAAVAMYSAKNATEGPQLYHSAFDSSSAETLSLLSELRQAVELGELRLFLQPKIAFDDARVVGAEALLRWMHPQRGLVSPALFVPFAEQTGFVRLLTLWVFEAACKEWEGLCATSGISLRISVNLSTRDLMDPELPTKLDVLLRRHGVPAEAFCLEITESAIMDDPQRAEATLQRLSERGFKLSIDDFGTGYSSLAYLKRLPVDELKIDRSFVMGMEIDADDAKIVRSTIDLAHNLGLTVVAEGVETAAVWNYLHNLDCDEAQGYHMSRPLSVPEFLKWQARWTDRAATGWAGLALQ